MTKEQEDKIIQQAQDIMERRFSVDNGLKLNTQSVIYYGAYYLGAVQAVQRITAELKAQWPKAGEERIYTEAFWTLITKSKRNMQMYLDGEETRYRNHQRDKRGKLKSVECYFVERRTLLIEKL